MRESLQKVSAIFDREAEDRFMVEVRRGRFFLLDVWAALEESQEELLLPMSVTFIGESGIDGGGPRRELNELLIRAISQSVLFSGRLQTKVTTLEVFV